MEGAIEGRAEGELREELGDLLLQVLFHSQLATERGKFSIADVVDTLSNKMIRRHPHVFGDQAVANIGEVWYETAGGGCQQQAATALLVQCAL